MKEIIELQAIGFCLHRSGRKKFLPMDPTGASGPREDGAVVGRAQGKKRLVWKYLMMQPGHCDFCPDCWYWSGYGQMRGGRYCFFFCGVQGQAGLAGADRRGAERLPQSRTTRTYMEIELTAAFSDQHLRMDFSPSTRPGAMGTDIIH